MCRGKELTENQRGGIIIAKKLGHTHTEISEAVGCSRSSVIRVLEAHELKKSPKKRTGRPPILNKSACNRLKVSVTRNKRSRRKTLSSIRLTYLKKNVSISTRTISKELAKQGVHSRVPRCKPLISEDNKAKRFSWALAHEHWNVEDFKKIMWSDESTYTQFQTSGFGRVWREPGEEFHEDCIAATVKKSLSRMFWGCFSWVGLGPLIPLIGRVTGEVYRDVLEEYAIPTVKLHAKKVKKNLFFRRIMLPFTPRRSQDPFSSPQKLSFSLGRPKAPT